MYARCAPSLKAVEVRKRKEEFKLYISMRIKCGLVQGGNCRIPAPDFTARC